MPQTSDFITQDGTRIPRIVPKVHPLQPGSLAAIQHGCLCPPGYNQAGRGFGGEPDLVLIRRGCPVHRIEYWTSLGNVS